MEVYMLIKAFLSGYANLLRKMRNLTQEQMAERLHISSRAYRDLEHGKYCFSAIPLLFLLLMMSEEELLAFLNNFRKKIADLEGTGDANDGNKGPIKYRCSPGTQRDNCFQDMTHRKNKEGCNSAVWPHCALLL